MESVTLDAGSDAKLRRALRPGSAPDLRFGFDMVSRVCAALGVKLVVEVV
jgi:DNA-binding phage protein